MEHKAIDWLYENSDSVNVIDVRNPNEYDEGHLPNAKNIPIFSAMFNPENNFDKNQTYYLYCHSGARVERIINEIEPQGYKVVNCSGIANLNKKYELIK